MNKKNFPITDDEYLKLKQKKLKQHPNISKQDFEDIMQQSVYNFLNQLTIQAIPNPIEYLNRCVENAINDLYRKQKKNTFIPINEHIETSAQPLPRPKKTHGKPENQGRQSETTKNIILEALGYNRETDTISHTPLHQCRKALKDIYLDPDEPATITKGIKRLFATAAALLSPTKRDVVILYDNNFCCLKLNVLEEKLNLNDTNILYHYQTAKTDISTLIAEALKQKFAPLLTIRQLDKDAANKLWISFFNNIPKKINHTINKYPKNITEWQLFIKSTQHIQPPNTLFELLLLLQYAPTPNQKIIDHLASILLQNNTKQKQIINFLISNNNHEWLSIISETYTL